MFPTDTARPDLVFQLSDGTSKVLVLCQAKLDEEPDYRDAWSSTDPMLVYSQWDAQRGRRVVKGTRALKLNAEFLKEISLQPFVGVVRVLLTFSTTSEDKNIETGMVLMPADTLPSPEAAYPYIENSSTLPQLLINMTSRSACAEVFRAQTMEALTAFVQRRNESVAKDSNFHAFLISI